MDELQILRTRCGEMAAEIERLQSVINSNHYAWLQSSDKAIFLDPADAQKSPAVSDSPIRGNTVSGPVTLRIDGLFEVTCDTSQSPAVVVPELAPYVFFKKIKGRDEWSSWNEFSDGSSGGKPLFEHPASQALSLPNDIQWLIDRVRKWGIENTGNEPSVSCFHRALDELVEALISSPRITEQDARE